MLSACATLTSFNLTTVPAGSKPCTQLQRRSRAVRRCAVDPPLMLAIQGGSEQRASLVLFQLYLQSHAALHHPHFRHQHSSLPLAVSDLYPLAPWGPHRACRTARAAMNIRRQLLQDAKRVVRLPTDTQSVRVLLQILTCTTAWIPSPSNALQGDAAACQRSATAVCESLVRSCGSTVSIKTSRPQSYILPPLDSCRAPGSMQALLCCQPV